MQYLVYLGGSLSVTRAIHWPIDRLEPWASSQQWDDAAKVFQIRRSYGVIASIRWRDPIHMSPRKFELCLAVSSV
jgi:hypothetical protein